MTNYLLLVDRSYANWLGNGRLVDELELLKEQGILKGEILSGEMMKLDDIDRIFPEKEFPLASNAVKDKLKEIFRGYAIVNIVETADGFKEDVARDICTKYNLEFRIC